LLVVGQQHHVVHVAQIGRGAQNFLDAVVQLVQVQIGEELAGEVADRDAATALQRGEQLVAVKIRRFGRR
jgi:hypothetical protein